MLSLTAVAVALLSAALPAALRAATSDTEVFRPQIGDVQLNPCVDELVATQGTMIVVDHVTTTQNGESHAFTFHYQGMTATGLLTGVKYVETHEETQSSYMSSD